MLSEPNESCKPRRPPLPRTRSSRIRTSSPNGKFEPERCQIVPPDTWAGTIQLVFLECGGRAQRRLRFGFFTRDGHTPPNGNYNPNRPMLLPLLGRNDSVAFPPIGSQTARSAALGVFTPGRTHSPNGTAVERQANDSPSPWGERAGVRANFPISTNPAGVRALWPVRSNPPVF